MKGLVLCYLLLALPGPALGWGSLAHQAIGTVAESSLSAAARQAVAKALAHDPLFPTATSLARISTWPDDLRAFLREDLVPPGWDTRAVDTARAFNTLHDRHAGWHFVNLPLAAAGYPSTSAPTADPVVHFVRDDDIVQMIGRCVRILEAAGGTSGFTKAQALSWLVHLVADLHQPLHVTTGFFDLTDPQRPVLVREPARAMGKLSDQGGNRLKLGDDRLHGLWDNCLAARAAGAIDCAGVAPSVLATRITSALANPSWRQAHRVDDWIAPGDHHAWPALWAGDSVIVARRAYDGLAFGPRRFEGAPHEPRPVIPILAPARSPYLSRHTDDALMQLAKASVRLEELLNRLDWK